MSKKTISEELFENFCDQNRIKWNPIPAELGLRKKTADYECEIRGLKFIVEVKQIELDAEERLAWERELAETNFASYSDTPGGRVRQKITDAKKQLKRLSKGKCPSILVLFNATDISILTEYDLLVGMYGLQNIVFENPADMNKSLERLYDKFGPGRRMTREHNTSISAVAVLKKDAKDNPILHIYHNIFAAIPINIGLLKDLPIRQFKIADTARFQNWIEICY